jgi:hypothetical protein
LTAVRRKFPWTSEQVNRLRVSWGAGRSASQIAMEFGITRDAVLGKAQRLGLMVQEPKWKPSRALTDSELAFAIDLRRREYGIKKIARMIGGVADSVVDRALREALGDEDLQYRAAGRPQLDRTKPASAERTRSPSEAFAERDAVLAGAPRSLTAALCGDPLPGRSALDRMRAP